MNIISRSLLIFATATVSIAACAQTASAPEPEWKKIPIPPLHAFKPDLPKRIVLDNGIVLLLEEDHELPLIDGFIRIRGGSRDVPAAKVGLISLYGQAWRTSGTKTHTGDEMDAILEAKAAKVETSGGLDSTSLHWSCLGPDFDQVFGLTTDLLLHPAFKEDKLTLAKHAAESGIARRNDDAGEIASREALKLVYGSDSPYGRDPEFATIAAVKLEDLSHWHDSTLSGSNMVIGVVGDFNSAEMEKKVRAAFASIPRGEKFVTAKQTFPGPKPGVYFVQKSDVNQSNALLVGLGTQRDNPDYYALSVMNEIFSGGFGSRLFQDVRTKLGLAYSVGGHFGAAFDYPGPFVVEAATKSASTVDALQAMEHQIQLLKTQPPTDTELRNAKDQLLNSFIFNYDSKDKILSEVATLEFHDYPLDFLERYRAGVEKVTAADVSRVAQKYIEPSKLAVLVVGNDAEFGKPLSTLGAVTPVDITIKMPAGMQNAPQGQPE
ncbi:MAG TPA: pitrilysin family protein [Acidobacteriaceae bacterium]|nr:pitrilysin family protein [Acidobacteriaceae bacterium]